MDGTVILSIIATIIAICGTIYGIISSKKQNDNSARDTNISQGREAGAVLSELGYIKAQIDEVKVKQDKMDDKYIKFIEELTKLTAFKNEATNKFTAIDRKMDDINKNLDKKVNDINTNFNKKIDDINNLIRHFHEEK